MNFSHSISTRTSSLEIILCVGKYHCKLIFPVVCRKVRQNKRPFEMADCQRRQFNAALSIAPNFYSIFRIRRLPVNTPYYFGALMKLTQEIWRSVRRFSRDDFHVMIFILKSSVYFSQVIRMHCLSLSLSLLLSFSGKNERNSLWIAWDAL